ncbi:cell division ATP-binding protein FtsE [Oculatella sp. FACHB-28]|uniref:cell division ATP-binding protein FtsE n=1 Tax=Cyanophyceae TaxID=3028117 RepID=UPI001688324C|nr:MULTISPECIES: cell division ATP-binding protein FtsE [Cyanophyceae]MBD2000729.1 cell division ATP-binding protein FtsE [Leptolyngbya sp. FACHB-541]MBD2056819.1 cell division ATP-binding protein FtsE [Oculatella sp. FACHB-28]
MAHVTTEPPLNSGFGSSDSPSDPVTAASPSHSNNTAKVIVSLQRVNKVYRNGSRALVDVSLQIRQGDFLFITGPSGSGKSTLLKLLYGEEKVNQGEVMVNDCNLSQLKGNDLSMLRRRIGVVFQDYKLIPRRTVSENVAFVLWAQGFTRKEIHRRLLPTLKMVGLQDKANCFPDELSGGEQQRVSIARAIVSTPPILLADEPTGNLDPDNSWQVIKILRKLNGIGITVVVTTHDEHLVRLSNHPVVQIRNGRLYHPRH